MGARTLFELKILTEKVTVKKERTEKVGMAERRELEARLESLKNDVSEAKVCELQIRYLQPELCNYQAR